MNKVRISISIITIIAIISLIGNVYATSKVNPNQTEFRVRFSGKPVVSNVEKVKASITNDVNATINVNNLTMEENTETVTYIIQNISKELSAELSLNIANSNKEYFSVESKIEKNKLQKGEATKVIVKIELLKEPVDEEQKATIGIQLDAKPIQPVKDNTNLYPNNNKTNSQPNNNNKTELNSGNNNKNTNYGYYEKDKTPKTGTSIFINFFRR